MMEESFQNKKIILSMKGPTINVLRGLTFYTYSGSLKRLNIRKNPKSFEIEEKTVQPRIRLVYQSLIGNAGCRKTVKQYIQRSERKHCRTSESIPREAVPQVLRSSEGICQVCKNSVSYS